MTNIHRSHHQVAIPTQIKTKVQSRLETRQYWIQGIQIF